MHHTTAPPSFAATVSASRQGDWDAVAAASGPVADLGKTDPMVEVLELAAAGAGAETRAQACAALALTLLSLGRPGAATAWARRSGDPDLLNRCLTLTPDYPYDDDLSDGLRRLEDGGIPYCRALSGGNVNRVYRVDRDGQSVVLRLGVFPPGEQGRFWRERHNMSVAAALGLAPPPLAMDVGDGTLILPYAAPGRIAVATRPEDVADLFRRLQGGPPLAGRADPLSALPPRLQRIGGIAFPMVADLRSLHDCAARIRAALQASAGPDRPCHADPQPANFVVDGDRLMLIDWQAAAMADPDWDVGLFLSRARLDGPTRRRFLHALCPDDTGRATARVELWEMMVHYLDLLEGLDNSLTDPEEAGWPALAHQALAHLRPWCGSGRPAMLIAAVRRP